MKPRSASRWVRMLSTLGLLVSLTCLSSLALAQEEDQDEAPAPSSEVFGRTQPMYDPEEAEETDDESASEETASAEGVFGQHTSTLYRGRLNRR